MLTDLGPEDAVSLEAQGYWRSIPTAHPQKDLFYPDKLSPEEQELATALADQTSAINLNAPYKDRWYQYGDVERTEFCFHAVKIPASRFSDGSYPVWYAAESQDASISEVLFHLRRQAIKELSGDGSQCIYFERALCKAEVKLDKGIDLRPLREKRADLVFERGPPYPACNAFGRRVRAFSEGIMTMSNRHRNAECVAVFIPKAIIRSVVKRYWNTKISGAGEIIFMDTEVVTFQDGWSSLESC
jgi:hypothetical protein